MEIEDLVTLNQVKSDESKTKLLIEKLIYSVGSLNYSPQYNEIYDEFRRLGRAHKTHPSKSVMRCVYEEHFKHIPINEELKRYFVKRIMRSESGVLVVTIVTKPGEHIKFSCPEKCAYCPTETDLNGNPTQPKSYISSEPAMLRATKNGFDIGEQIKDRIRSYMHTGNLKGDDKKKKIEVILSGGTWDVMPKEYRDQVVNEIYYNFNILFGDARPMLSIQEEKEINETALFGVIGLTIETRPDYVTKKSLLEYLEYGVTRVQLGGQSTHDDILLKIKRGCTVKNMKTTIRILKGIGMKVVTHWMPDLPGSSPSRDTEMFDTLLTSPDLQSDDWKVYPCAVVKSDRDDLIIKSEISEWKKDGSYVQYAETNVEDLIDVCVKFKTKIHPWIRIERLVRDIPSQSIEAGYNKITNLREMIQKKMKRMGLSCKCIRCMEIKDRSHLIDKGKVVVRKYEASGGIEYHISFEVEKTYWTWSYILFYIMFLWNRLFGKTIYYGGNKEMYCGLFGFLRLRIDQNPGLDLVEELKGCGLIREVHVYGSSTSVGNTNEKSSQHKGVGQKLMRVAEDIVKSHLLFKTAVIAGVGAREYYKNKCGYSLGKYYMIKKYKQSLH
jgi:ELP3 family radical SAM enzyme/protein acetyltransferase